MTVMRAIGIFFVLLVGCAVEPGAPQGASLGSTEQAITANLTAARADGGACALSISSKDVLLYGAGYSALTPGLSVAANIYLAEQGTGFVTPTGTTSVPTAVADLQVVLDPNDSSSCISLGGELANGTANADAVRLTVTKPSSYNIASTTLTGLTARSHFRTMKCGSNSLIVVNGKAGGSSLANIQVLTAGATAFTNVTVTGTLRAREDFTLSVVGDGTQQNFVALLGSRSGSATNDADVLEFTASDCSAVTVTQLSNVLDATGSNPAALTEVNGFETKYDTVTASPKELTTITVPGGTSGSTSYSGVSKIVIDMNGTPALDSKSYTNAVLQGTMRRYSMVTLPNGDSYISGGTNQAGTALAFVTKFARTSGTITSPGNLSNARERHALVYLSNDAKLQHMGGNTGNTVMSSNEETAP